MNGFRLVMVFMLLAVSAPFNVEAATIGANTCATIDANWKEYNRQILGANTKVSDVVLNACAAIGGGCTFSSGKRSRERNEDVGGAEKSQHIQGTAIDLKVTPGKEVEFLTLAICGLRRVNNCQGGLGYYKSKAIHVDVRTNTSAVWSTGFRRVNIANNVGDPKARSLLYGFGDGKCTDGSIQGDYSDEHIYGPPAEYQIPKFDATAVYASLIGQQVGYGLTQLLRNNSTTGGGKNVDASNIVYRDNTTNEDLDLLLPTESDLLRDDSAQTQDILDTFLSGSQEQESEQGGVLIHNPPTQEPTHTECTEGFLGSGLFKKCATTETAVEDGVVTTIEVVRDTSENGVVNNVLSQVFGGNNFTFSDEGEVQRVRTSGGGIDVFYGVHSPQDPNDQQLDTSNTLPSYTQFQPGETRRVVREVPRIIGDSIRFAELTTRFGAYYGLMHGISPLVVGSAPRTIVRIYGGTIAMPTSEISL